MHRAGVDRAFDDGLGRARAEILLRIGDELGAAAARAEIVRMTVKLGAVTSVILSVLEVPESEAAIRSGVPPVGAVVSSVMFTADVVEVLPAASPNWAEIDLEPSEPRSPEMTVSVTLPVLISLAVMVWFTGCVNAAPLSSN